MVREEMELVLMRMRTKRKLQHVFVPIAIELSLPAGTPKKLLDLSPSSSEYAVDVESINNVADEDDLTHFREVLHLQDHRTSPSGTSEGSTSTLNSSLISNNSTDSKKNKSKNRKGSNKTKGQAIASIFSQFSDG
ncbi:unnamed protein product [Acanthoscelides obtectus]|uniref:Uncharacterized protein n=1 Tax=Acanthoscelides obtectus TaxID=200917 RepID=A0A9P0PEG4_ACAOB|nr:unnamed protein product [Acanthoscelides obtectus]CAK1639249.1 hypothetical protein AOBTE_LOCUS11065 [Acanthoscelides obtectus]